MIPWGTPTVSFLPRSLAPVTRCLVLLVLIIPGFCLAGDPPVAEPSGLIHAVRWQAEGLGRRQAGSALWIADSEAALRLEILPGSGLAGELEALLNQTGDGYCLVLAGVKAGTFNPWGEGWRKVPASAGAWVTWLTRLLQGQDAAVAATGLAVRQLPDSPPVGPRPRFLAPDQPAGPAGRLRVQLPEVAVDPAGLKEDQDGDTTGPLSFRHRQSGRAAGRGGQAEIITVAGWEGSGPWTRSVASSRKPGRLLLTGPEVWSTGPVGLEVFTPLWPLAQLLEIGPKISGTPGPDRR